MFHLPQGHLRDIVKYANTGIREAARQKRRKNMVPGKVRRPKRVLGILKRIQALRESRQGRNIRGISLTANEVNRKLFWRMRKVATDKEEAVDD